MNKCKTLVSLSLAAVLVLSAASPLGAQAEEAIKWSGWPGGQPSDLQGFKWGFPELWWYGKAKVFSYNVELEYKSDSATHFWVKGTAKQEQSESFFGTYAEWGNPLDAGYIYRFTLRMPDKDGIPDFIAINNSVVWTKAEYDEKTGVVQFTYVPASDKEAVKIYLIRKLDPKDNTTQYAIYPPHQGVWKDDSFISRRAPYPDPRPDYDTFTLPEGTEYTGLDPHIAASYRFEDYGHGVDYGGYTIPELPYPSAETKVVERWLPVEKGGVYYGYAQTDIATFQPSNDREQNFDIWSDAVKAAGTKQIALTPVLDRMHTTKGVTEPGTYMFYHLNEFPLGSPKINKGTTVPVEERSGKLELLVDTMAMLAHKWLEKVPDGTVYLFDVESNSKYGAYKGGMLDSNMALFPGYEAIRNGGANAWELAFDFHQNEFYHAIMQSDRLTVEDKARIDTMANYDRAAFQGAYAYKSGADVMFHKNIHRQSANVVTANTRGAADAYDKEYGYDFDNWDRQYAYGYAPEGIEQVLKTYFHAGANYVMDEIASFDPQTNKITEWGKAWIEFWHYAKTHPKLGEQQVRIGVMRGLGDEWNAVAGQSASWEANPWFPRAEMNKAFEMAEVPQKWVKAKQAQESAGTYTHQDTYQGDYNLLNLVFSNMGSSHITKEDRLATGTPYGPVNFIPWDTSVNKLDPYDVVMYFGRGVGITEQEVDNLTQYVKNGGKLVMAAGQLRKEDHQLIADSLMGIGLGEEKTLDQLPYTLLTATGEAEVVAELSNGDPAAVKTAYGAGELYLLSGEWLTYWDESTASDILQPMLEESKWLEFDQPSDWLEYMVQKKGSSWVIPVLNHGRGFFPSGNGIDHGVWNGTIRIDLDQLGLEGKDVGVYKVRYDRDSESMPISLEPVEFAEADGRLDIKMSVAQVEELVIGPADRVKLEYFGIQDYSPVTGVALDKTEASLYPWAELKLHASAASDQPEDAAVNWSSSDPGVASVDADGVVTAHAKGEAVIRASVADIVNNKEYSAELALTVETPGVTGTFLDLVDAEWSRLPVEVLASKGIMKGVSGDRFEPLQTISGTDYADMLMKVLNLEASAGVEAFADAKEILSANSLTREEMIVLTAKALEAAGKLKLEGDAEAVLSGYSDSAAISGDARTAISALIEEGIVEGYDSAIHPQEPANRGQAAVLIYKILIR